MLGLLQVAVACARIRVQEEGRQEQQQERERQGILIDFEKPSAAEHRGMRDPTRRSAPRNTRKMDSTAIERPSAAVLFALDALVQRVCVPQLRMPIVFPFAPVKRKSTLCVSGC